MDNIDTHFLIVSLSVLLLSIIACCFSMPIKRTKGKSKKTEQLFNVSIIVDDKYNDDIFEAAFRYFKMPLANKQSGFTAYRMEKQPFDSVRTVSKMFKDSNVNFKIETEHTKKAISYCFVILSNAKNLAI